MLGALLRPHVLQPQRTMRRHQGLKWKLAWNWERNLAAGRLLYDIVAEVLFAWTFQAPKRMAFSQELRVHALFFPVLCRSRKSCFLQLEVLRICPAAHNQGEEYIADALKKMMKKGPSDEEAMCTHCSKTPSWSSYSAIMEWGRKTMSGMVFAALWDRQRSKREWRDWWTTETSCAGQCSLNAADDKQVGRSVLDNFGLTRYRLRAMAPYPSSVADVPARALNLRMDRLRRCQTCSRMRPPMRLEFYVFCAAWFLCILGDRREKII